MREYDEDIDQIAQRISKLKDKHQKFDNLGRLKSRVKKLEHREESHGKFDRGEMKSFRDPKNKNAGESLPGKKEKDCALI